MATERELGPAAGARRLRVAVLTRTGRGSGARLARAVARSRHELCGILAEARGTMIRRTLKRKSLRVLLRQYGWRFVLHRAADWVREEYAAAAGQRQVDALSDSPRRAAADLNVPLRVVNSLNAPESVFILREWAADVLVVANAPVLKPVVFRACRLAAVNFHSGRLPEYGGMASEFWALYRGEPTGWSTIHRVTEQLDTGEILAECPVPIWPGDTPDSLHSRCVEAAEDLLVPVLDRLAAGDTRSLRAPGPATLLPWPTPEQQRAWRTRGAAQTTKR